MFNTLPTNCDHNILLHTLIYDALLTKLLNVILTYNNKDKRRGSRGGKRKQTLIKVQLGHRPVAKHHPHRPTSCLTTINCDDRPHNKSQLKIMNLNCRSLISVNKRTQFEQIILTHKPDIIMATETHLDDCINNSSIINSNYLNPPPYRKDRSFGEGGVLIATHNELVSQEKEIGAECELQWIKVSSTNGDLLVGCFYRQPTNKSTALKELRSSLRKLHRNESKPPNIILGGDFNLPDINWDTLEINKTPQYGKELYKEIIDIMNEFHLTQMVKEPTRGDNILDLFFTNNPNLAQAPIVYPGMSDHRLVCLELCIKLKKKPKPPRSVLLFTGDNINIVKNDLVTKFEEFRHKAPQNCVDENWEAFKNVVMGSADTNIPKKAIGSKPHLPWITKEIKRLVRRKKRLYNRAKRFNREKDWASFKEIRKLIHTKLRMEHKRYVHRLLEIDSEDDPNHHKNARITKRFWTYIKAKRKDTCGINVLINRDGTEASDSKEKADTLNNQYASVFTKETDNLPNLEYKDIPTLPRITITTNGILKQLHALDVKKSAGPDGIPTRLLKEAAQEIAPYLQIIFQQSLDTGDVPKDWKRANITPIFKKGMRNDPSNYRPVSLTSVSCKVLEHIIYHNIMDHLDEHNILVDHQHGFRKKRSCETQLLATLESITKSYDKMKQIDLIVLDFSKAFDTVAHQRLLRKLDQVGIRNITHDGSCNTPDCNGECEQKVHRWFQNWLCSRTQKVVLEGQYSDACLVTSGVPQGTVLGPLCFLIYINDIGNELSSQTSLKLFADDSMMFREITSREDSHILQQDIDKLIKWSEKWQMAFHPSKCQVMTIGRKRKKIHHQYTIQGQNLQHVNSIRYLGVHIQNDLKWDRHINEITRKANLALGFVKRNLNDCPEATKAHAYTSIVRPSLEYASTVWDPHLQKHVKEIEGVQRRAARFVKNCHSREPGCMTGALKSLGWTPLETRRRSKRLTRIYKIITEEETTLKIPDHFMAQNNRYSTRNYHIHKFTKPHIQTDTYKFSFFPRTLDEWNLLPNSTINSRSVDSFRATIDCM